MDQNQVLGIDVGGSGIKGAVVDVTTGTLVSERHRIPTPQPAKPEAVLNTIADIVDHFNWQGPIGCGFPAAFQQGIARTAANIDDAFLGFDVQQQLNERCQQDVILLNDADAAGLAEMRWGIGREHQQGVTIMITIGTGLGSALFFNGQLYPNTELGHLLLANCKEGEHYAAGRIRDEHDLSWKKWGKRFNKYLHHVEQLFWPDCFILGGGVSKKFAKFAPYLDVSAEVVAAQTQNHAGIIGAAMFAHEHS